MAILKFYIPTTSSPLPRTAFFHEHTRSVSVSTDKELWGMQSLRTISTCRLISTKTLCPQVVSTACVFFVLVSWRRMIFRSTFLAFFWHLEQTLSFEEFFDFSKNVLCLRKSLRLKERRRFSTKIYRRTRSKVLWRKKLIKIHDQVYLEK